MPSDERRMKCPDCQAGRHTSPPHGHSLCGCGERTCACYGWDKGGFGWTSRHVPQVERVPPDGPWVGQVDR